MNFKLVLDWVKKNVFIVVFGVIIIAAPIVGWLIGSGIKDGVQKSLDGKRADFDAMGQLEKTPLTLNIPGREAISKTGLVNQKLLEAYNQLVDSLRSDAEEVRKQAIEHNSKGRDVILAGVFPKPEDSARQEIHEKVYPAIQAAYYKLLESVHAGSPPDRRTVVEQLERRQSNFIATASPGKRTREGLSAEDRKRLDEDLTKARKGIYADTARSIALYATPDSIGMPPPPRSVPTSGMPLDQMFDWNWNLWIAQDVVEAIASMNKGSENVLSAPVKRIISMRPDVARAKSAAAPADAGAAGGGASNGPGLGPSAPAAPSDPNAPATPAGPFTGGDQVDPKAEVKLDFTTSITGRSTNALYDVRQVGLRVVVATNQVPALADAFAKRNFITITKLSLRPADPFAAAREGYMYGLEPCSEVTMTLELIYLREWTTLRMPDEMRRRLNTAGAKPEATGSAPQGTGT